MKHLKINCQKHEIDSVLLSPRCMTNSMKSCSFLHAHFFELMKVVENLLKQDQTLRWTCVAGAHRCVNSRYAKFKYTGMKSDYIQITQRNLQ